ncbi:hypothetical protein H9Q10_04155 [Eikenella sp. S3360]|uniref:Uncharacterized protein n=1 Tax=Eikenella glucosivorans TaxID=2766967 RepID=A0ABS0N991_9NEIS|nr:hypothetical protein [Eikenella glucosivorans]MBH5328859.1 hypothetical protein [Eikenella glucosivorans]
MFDKQVRFRVGEFDGEKECAAGNEVSAITRHGVSVWFMGLGKNDWLFCSLILSMLEFSDGIGGRLKI